MKEKKQSCVLSGETRPRCCLCAERSLCWKSFPLLVCIFNSVIIKALYVFQEGYPVVWLNTLLSQRRGMPNVSVRYPSGEEPTESVLKRGGNLQGDRSDRCVTASGACSHFRWSRQRSSQLNGCCLVLEYYGWLKTLSSWCRQDGRVRFQGWNLSDSAAVNCYRLPFSWHQSY